MNVQSIANGVILDFGSAQRRRVRLFFVLEAALGLGFAYLIFRVREWVDGGVALWLFWAGFIALYLLYAYRFLRRATSRERLILTPERLQLEHRSLFGRRLRSYEVARIANWQYHGPVSSPEHPLATQHFDYLGFETTRKVIDRLHEEGNFSFDYDGKRISFGKGLYSWDAEEVARYVGAIMRNDLTVADADAAFLKEHGLEPGRMP